MNLGVRISTQDKNKIKVIQLSDMHLYADKNMKLLGVNTYSSFKSIINHVITQHSDADLMLVTGDLSQDETLESYKNFTTLMQPIPFPVFYAPGNHDDQNLINTICCGNIDINKKIIINDCWQIILLNSCISGFTRGTVVQSELDFIDTCMQEHPDKFTLLAMHHNPIKMQSSWLDEYTISNSEHLLAKIVNYPKIKVVLWGHVHQELELIKNGIKFFATPSTSIQFKPLSKDFALDSIQSGFRIIYLGAKGEVISSVERTGTNFNPDYTQKGY